MTQRDYILRLIEQLARVVAALITQRREAAPEAIEVTLADAANGLLGLGLADLELLSLTEWRRLLRPHGTLDAERTVVAATLLDELAITRAEQGEARRADRLAARALALLLDVAPQPPTGCDDDLNERIERLARTLHPLPRDVVAPLLEHYERRSAWGRAEDTLFEWRAFDSEAAQQAGAAFYARLAQLSDEQLERGGMTRAELLEGSVALRGGDQT